MFDLARDQGLDQSVLMEAMNLAARQMRQVLSTRYGNAHQQTEHRTQAYITRMYTVV